MEKILEVKDLKTYFYSSGKEIRAVDGVSFTLNRGEILGIVGESGSGKSVTSLSIMRLVPSPPGKIVGGEIIFAGEDLLKLSEKEMRKIRGEKISMIFQDPMTSLNPVFTIEEQLLEVFRVHKKLSKKEAREKAVELLKKVGIPEAERRLKSYPHQFSGGMRQRVMIAMALALNPALLIADEPTTALDVTIQAQILALMKELQKEYGTSIIMITHDLGVVAEMCHKVLVMYAGRPVEFADVKTLFANPKHPYTLGLLNSIPRLKEQKTRLTPIEGSPPDLGNLPRGCAFYPRCSFKQEVCSQVKPDFLELPDRKIACHLYQGVLDDAAAS
ncbi:ABC transporter ATP-binding protein [Carboxydothermus hydrogenoformans]|uniref:Oligopeptide/dipeptide ABC transporter, ATP-binding protein n=1 Tax=Carboxydothermus hydrogenoformans (strain ATCC BAA-161 / DSM 6008 / Z-2901) TaxID=246194 RepID=Q3AD12_CARHZ|nr:ABC transporter ATP-binding protein [Carboxydothermus hydrogenoformans]ABB14633.1 oligopeptide/dipeptide ABC transporter, ATP-binding protein [Carboxydothermus hydrogenoformans Z-2901]